MSQGLLNDIIFKVVFGVQNSEPVLLALLNALLGYSGERKIASLTIENPTFDKEYLTDKGAILDLKAVDILGRWYNIELQLEPGGLDDYHIKRSVFYLSKLYADQLDQGQSYSKLAKAIHISLLDFVLFKESHQLHSIFHLKEAETGALLSDIIELHYIELKKFSASKPHHLRTPFEKWLYILKFSELYLEPDSEPLPDNLKQEEGIQMAIESMRKAHARDEVREIIRSREKARRDYLSGLKEAELRGLEQGREEGLEQGRREAARAMLAAGIELTIIHQTLGVKPEDLT